MNGDSEPTVRVVTKAHFGQWAVSAVGLLLVILALRSVVTNPHFEWGTVGSYIVSPIILEGVAKTLEFTAIGMTIGIAIGILVALMRLSDNFLLRTISAVYVAAFRGTPLLVQLLFWYNIAALYPTLVLGVPFGPALWTGSANTLITPLSAAMLGLGLNEGAYMAEIVRGGMLGVDRGQRDAALSLGMTRLQIVTQIVLPQAMRLIIPPTGNQVISMLKSTSLISILAITELLYTAQLIYSRTFQTIPLLIVASIWYLVFTSVLSVIQSFLERRAGRGFTGGARIG